VISFGLVDTDDMGLEKNGTEGLSLLSFGCEGDYSPTSHLRGTGYMPDKSTWDLRRTKLQGEKFLGAFAILHKTTLSFVMSVRLFTGNNSAHTGQIFTQPYSRVFKKTKNLPRKFKYH